MLVTDGKGAIVGDAVLETQDPGHSPWASEGSFPLTGAGGFYVNYMTLHYNLQTMNNHLHEYLQQLSYRK